MNEPTLKKLLDKNKQESCRMDQYYGMVMNQHFNYNTPLDLIIFKIKFNLAKLLCYGSDAKILIVLCLPFMFFVMKINGSEIAAWLKTHLKINVNEITTPLFDLYMKAVKFIACSVTYYWALWLTHYLKNDTSYHATINKITRNVLVPLDMIGFYRVMIMGNDPTFEFVKEIVKENFYEEYKSRQIRNGMVPQF
jgi:hypothetical protein